MTWRDERESPHSVPAAKSEPGLAARARDTRELSLRRRARATTSLPTAASRRRCCCCAAGRFDTAVASQCVSGARAALRRASRLVARDAHTAAVARAAAARLRPSTVPQALTLTARPLRRHASFGGHVFCWCWRRQS
jgi:hypothetical protein